MCAALVDHLWQSTWFCAVIGFLAYLTRANCAQLRLWLWRAAALKFVFPFALLFAIGAWLGFPVPHSGDSAPPALIEAFAWLTPLASPAKARGWTGLQQLLALAFALPCAAVAAWWIRNRLRCEQQCVVDETARREHDDEHSLPWPGFFKAALLTAVSLSVVSAPMLAGAIDDRQQRRQRLIDNSLTLRHAPVAITPAPTGIGTRPYFAANVHGVTIRNINIRELVALVYGVNLYAVWGQQLAAPFADPKDQSWLTSPRYDIRVIAPVKDPKEFDPYALRQVVTKYLADRFGLSIHVNSECQPPCGNYQVPMPEDPL